MIKRIREWPSVFPSILSQTKENSQSYRSRNLWIFPTCSIPRSSTGSLSSEGREPGAKATARQLQGSTPSAQETLHGTHMSRAEQSRAASSYRSVGRGQFQGQARKPT